MREVPPLRRKPTTEQENNMNYKSIHAAMRTALVAVATTTASLIAAGVKIYRFKDGFVHSKTMLSDGDTAVVGTINLDFRSFVHHFECAVWLYKTSSINDIYADFINLFDEKSERVTEGQAKLKWYESLIKSFLNLFAPLM